MSSFFLLFFSVTSKWADLMTLSNFSFSLTSSLWHLIDLTIYLHLIRIYIIVLPILSMCRDLGGVIGISNVLSHWPEMTQSLSSLPCPSSVLSPKLPFPPLISSSHPSLTHSLGFYPWASVLLFFKASIPSLDFLCHLLGHGFHICYLQPFLQPHIFHCLLDISTWVSHQHLKITEDNFTAFLSKIASPPPFPYFY